MMPKCQRAYLVILLDECDSKGRNLILNESENVGKDRSLNIQIRWRLAKMVHKNKTV